MNKKWMVKSDKKYIDYLAQRLLIISAIFLALSLLVFIPLSHSLKTQNQRSKNTIESLKRNEDIVNYQIDSLLSEDKIYQTLIDLKLIEP